MTSLPSWLPPDRDRFDNGILAAEMLVREFVQHVVAFDFDAAAETVRALDEDVSAIARQVVGK